MRLIALSLIAALTLSASESTSDSTPLPASDQPVYTQAGELTYPAGYREWVFLGSGLGMTYGPAAPRPGENPSFDNVFVNPSAFARFKETGRWPDGTIFALEVRYSTSHGSINQGGHYQTDLAALEVEVKDSKRFPEGGMAFFAFGGGLAAPPASAKALPANTGCIACHTTSGAVDATFVQFYPTALAIAEARGTLRADYVPPPPSPSRFGHVLREKGWAAAEKILADSRSQDPYASVLQEGPLNGIGYSLLQQKENVKAIALFRWIADTFPKSVNARDSLADAYESDGKVAEALAETDKELALLEADTTLAAPTKAQLRKAIDDRRARLAKR